MGRLVLQNAGLSKLVSQTFNNIGGKISKTAGRIGNNQKQFPPYPQHNPFFKLYVGVLEKKHTGEAGSLVGLIWEWCYMRD